MLWFLVGFLILDSADQFDAEELLDDILSSRGLSLLRTEAERILEGGEQGRIALLGVLLFVVTVIVGLVKLRVNCAQCLHESEGREWLALGF